MKTIILSAALATLSLSQLSAQNGKQEKLDDFDEIVIKKKGSKNKAAVTIEISDDNVIINGKPLDKFISDDLSVRIKKAKINGLDNGKNYFEFDMNNQANTTKGKTAMLGVSTEKDEKGALIEDVNEGSAAEKAGLKEGDIITKVNEDKITSPEDLRKVIKAHKPEDEVTISFIRDGKNESKKVKLGSSGIVYFDGQNGSMNRSFNFDRMPNFDSKQFDFGEMFKGFGDESGEGPRVFGFGNKAKKPTIGIKATDVGEDKGISINEVKKDSHADKAGLKVGDIITEIAGEPVFNSSDLKKALQNINEGDHPLFKITRAGKSQEIKVVIAKPIKTVDF